MIRPAEIGDIEEINNLGILVNSNFRKLFNIKDILNKKFSKIFVYIDNNQIVGFIHITELYEAADIINVVVKEEYRRNNIASNLIDYMLSDLSRGVKLLTLEVNVNNIAAIKLYKKFGFDIINTRKHYYNNDDAYLMGKGIE